MTANLIKVPNSGNVILPCFPNEMAIIGNNDSRVPNDIVRIPFEDGRDDNHVRPLSQILAESGRRSSLCGFRKFRPGQPFPSAECERHG